MKIKVKIKELSIYTEKAKSIYQITFTPCEKVMVCNEVFCLGVDGGTAPITFLANWIENVKVSQDIFLFVSNHSRDFFVIDIERVEDGNSSKTELRKVTLIYG